MKLLAGLAALCLLAAVALFGFFAMVGAVPSGGHGDGELVYGWGLTVLGTLFLLPVGWRRRRWAGVAVALVLAPVATFLFGALMAFPVFRPLYCRIHTVSPAQCAACFDGPPKKVVETCGSR